MPTVAARAGSPRRTVTPAMRAAFSACAGDSCQRVPSTSATHASTFGVAASLRPSTVTTVTTAPASSARPATVAHPTRAARRRRRRRVVTEASVRVQDGVELDAGTRAGDRLHPAGERVAPEQHVVRAGQVAGLDDGAVERGAVVVGEADEADLGAGGHVEAGLDDAVV